MDKNVLSKVVTNDAAGVASYLSAAEGKDLAEHNPPLIEVNAGVIDPADASKVLVRSTQAGRDYLAAGDKPAANGHAIIKNVVLPEAKKRGNTSGNGAPSKYPFATMEIGDTFFSPDSEHTKGDALKGLGSTVSANNDKYSVQKMDNGVGVTKPVTRAVRDPATKKAKIGPDGKKITETVDLPVKEYNRKFTIRAVEAGKKYGEWVAPANGAIVARTV